MKHKEIEKLFSGKLSMQLSDKKRHKQFSFFSAEGDKISLPQIFCLSRGRGEVHKNNISSLANMMGMTHSEFETAAKCNIGPSACVLGMITSILKKAKVEIDNDPIANNWDSTLLLHIPQLLSEASSHLGKKIGKKDDDFVAKISSVLGRINEDSKGVYKEYVIDSMRIADAIKTQNK